MNINPHKFLKNNLRLSVFLSVLICVIFAGFLVYQNIDFSSSPELPPPPQQERTPRQEEHSELLIEDLVIKEGPRWVAKGDTIVVHYVGMFLDGSVFDSSVEKDRPFVFRVGDGNVIQGWEIGVEGMRPGEKRKITIPPELAYGQGGVRDIVPPNTTVVFEIELLEIR